MNKILIVDDEALSRKAMEKNFGKYGEYVAVDNGNEAIKAFREALTSETPFTLVVLDYSLEDKTGLDVLKAIRAMEKEQKLTKQQLAKIVMATGNRERNVVRECIAGGCNDYILKPIKADMVSTKMKDLGFNIMEKEPEKPD